MYEDFDSFIEAEYQERMKDMVKPEPPPKYFSMDIFLGPDFTNGVSGCYLTVEYSKEHFGILPFQYLVSPHLSGQIIFGNRLNAYIKKACENNYENLYKK
jgi:hypothetical protein